MQNLVEKGSEVEPFRMFSQPERFGQDVHAGITEELIRYNVKGNIERQSDTKAACMLVI